MTINTSEKKTNKYISNVYGLPFKHDLPLVVLVPVCHCRIIIIVFKSFSIFGKFPRHTSVGLLVIILWGTLCTAAPISSNFMSIFIQEHYLLWHLIVTDSSYLQKFGWQLSSRVYIKVHLPAASRNLQIVCFYSLRLLLNSLVLAPS